MFNRMDFTFKREWGNITIRFYPKKSFLYIFNESENEEENIYKADYRWSLLEEEKTGSNDISPKKEILKFQPDENSVLVYLHDLIDSLFKDPPEYNIKNSVGGCGFDSSEWDFIRQHVVEFKDEEDFDGSVIEKWLIQVWSSNTQQGYKFLVSKQELEDFKNWLSDVHNYMLAHSKKL